MEDTLTKIVAYHYTNAENYKSMKTPGVDGFHNMKFNDFTGLLPRRRFIYLGDGKNLPSKAYDPVIEGVLAPEPDSWVKNPEFPNFWRYLMHDVCRRDEIMLLNFELNSDDDAYVVERAHVERELYGEAKGLGESTKESKHIAFRKYWDSRVPVFDYDGSYDAPQLAIWSGIEFDRLNIEWVKPVDKVWKRVLANGW